MKANRAISLLLAVCMLLTVIPAVKLFADGTTPYADPVYNRIGRPEVAIFNAYTGASETDIKKEPFQSEFFTKQMKEPTYNAVANQKFHKVGDSVALLNYDAKIKDNSTYVWEDFYNSNLAYLSDKYQELQAGYAITRTSNSHKHTWKLIYKAEMTSYINTELYLHDPNTDQYWGMSRFTGFSRQGATLRQGNGGYQSLGYTINGANSRYMYISGVQQAPIRKSMYINFHNSSLYYDGQNKTCNCGGSATGAMVFFYDGTAPTIKSVEIKKGSTVCSDFKADDVITVVLHCSEPLRFADDDATGKGEVYIGLMAEGYTDRLYAHLTSLDGDTLTFTYHVDENDKNLYTITGLDLTSAPTAKGGLIHTSANIDLYQVYEAGRFTVTNPKSGGSALGYNKTTCYVTDMAGNALRNTPSSPNLVSLPNFYIDCEQPYIALANLSADTKNGDIKTALKKTDLSPSDPFYMDNSDDHLGVGDSFCLTLYMNEVVTPLKDVYGQPTGAAVTVTTNIIQPDNSYLTLNAVSSGTTAKDGVGKQYGKGASNGSLTVFYTSPVTITPGMTVEGSGGIAITGVSFTGVTDASGNAAVGAAKSPDKKYYIDTAAPVITAQPAVQTGGVNNSFYLPFTVTDGASDVQSLPASLMVSCGKSTAAFQYAVTASASQPSAWTDGALGTSLSFVQTGGQQYLHVKPVANESYAIYQNAKVVFTLSDYAGNTGSSEAPLSGVLLDTVKPASKSTGSAKSYDNDARLGTLTVTIEAEDLGGLASVQVQWSDTAITESSSLTGSWENAIGVLDGNPTRATLTADATVSAGNAFSGRLWAKVTDVAGNSKITDLGEFSYNLKSIQYALDYERTVTAAASITVPSLDADGKLVLDVQKSKDDTHYITVVDTAGSANVFGGTWYTATFSNTSGYRFTDLTAAGSFLSGYTGNLLVTVYSGNSETITQSANAITLTTNAGVDPFTLRVSPSDNTLSDVFDGTDILTVNDDTLAALSSYTQMYPWSYGRGSSVSSTLEGVQVSINLGSDKNRWGYEDVDWENSFLALYPANTVAPGTLSELQANKLCAIGSGAVQTVTLPAFDYVSGYYHLALVLMRHSDSNAYYQVVLQDDDGDANIHLDVTQPGSLSLGVLAKREKGMAWAGGFEISYDPDTAIFIPTEGYDVFLSVEALDVDGNTINFDGANGAHINAGAVDVIAWNTADPDNKISLSHEHYIADTDGQVWQDQENDSYPTNGNRMLRFGETTTGAVAGFPSGILGLTPDQDNIIALQVQYANGKASAVTYLTVHPVSLHLTGTIATTPTVDESVYGPFSQFTTSGLITADPGTAGIIFTPDSNCNTTGLTLYCDEGYAYVSGNETRYFTYGGYMEDKCEMTLESDGSYTFQVPTADAEAFAGASAAFAEDPENNEHPGRNIDIFEFQDTEVYNAILDGGNAVGYYVVYATDQYGNIDIVGITKNAILADGGAPIVTGDSLTTADSAFTATFTIRDSSLYSFGRDNSWTDRAMSRPMELTLSYDEAYAAAIGASGENLTLTADASGENYVWVADTANKLGITEVDAVLTRDGQFHGADGMATYYNGATDVYLTVTVKGIVSPKITSATDMTLNLSAKDAHGNTAEAASLTASVTGSVPAVTAMSFDPIQMTPGISDLALFVTFNQPVQPLESWIKRDISGFNTVWQDAFPITNDGVWDINFTDVFGTVYTVSVDTADYKGDKDSVFGVYGFDLSFSTLDYVAASEGVTITASYTGTDGDSLHISRGWDTLTSNQDADLLHNRSVTVTENGEYKIYLYGESGWTEKLIIHLNNIVSGGPEETLYFYVDEVKEEYIAGAANQFRGTTTAPVTVSYRTSRDTSPVGDTTLTFHDGDDDSFTFQYYDLATDFTYTISGKLSDYGITLAAPATPYADNEAPTVGLVTVWTQRASGFVQANAFPGSASQADIRSAIEDSGFAQSYDFVVNASDYSKWKLVVKSTEPTEMSYASASSDAIAGVSVSGNNVLVTKDVAGDFWIVVVDNAKADSAATADNFTAVKIPAGSYSFDTTAPVIETRTVNNGLYSKTVYLKASDLDDAGNPTGAVTLTGAGLLPNSDAGYTEYPWKLVFTDNDTVVVVTATDAAGNMSVSNIQVSGIDGSSPVLTVTWSPCFKDPTTGTLNENSPTSGPVNTDVVAHITSDKEIASVKVDGNWNFGPQMTELTDYWNDTKLTYSSQQFTIEFTTKWETSYQLEVFAPNGKSTTIDITLGDGVIDKTPPLNSGDVWDYIDVEDLTREGYAIPYAVRLSLCDPDEDIFCLSSGPAGVVYNEDNPFTVDVTDNKELNFTFSDKAGNLQEVWIPAPTPADLDSVAPAVEISGLADDAAATNGSVDFTVKVLDETEITLTANDDSVTFGALTESTDSDGNTVWTGTVSAGSNGTFRLTATDLAGNSTCVSFTVNNIDKVLPLISFDRTTFYVRQDSDASELAALLDVTSDSIHTWDNAGIREGSLAYDASGVDLTEPGVYAVPYTVEDIAGNVGQAVRYIKVFDKHQPVVSIDGELTEQGGVTNLTAGTHILSVTGLKAPNEPYTLKLVKGIWSAGQMKRAPNGILVGADGSFTIPDPGFYTLYLITQSRQTYRVLLYVED